MDTNVKNEFPWKIDQTTAWGLRLRNPGSATTYELVSILLPPAFRSMQDGHVITGVCSSPGQGRGYPGRGGTQVWYPPAQVRRGGYPVRTTEGVFTTRRAVCLLRSRRRTFLFSNKIFLLFLYVSQRTSHFLSSEKMSDLATSALFQASASFSCVTL